MTFESVKMNNLSTWLVSFPPLLGPPSPGAGTQINQKLFFELFQCAVINVSV